MVFLCDANAQTANSSERGCMLRSLNEYVKSRLNQGKTCMSLACQILATVLRIWSQTFRMIFENFYASRTSREGFKHV